MFHAQTTHERMLYCALHETAYHSRRIARIVSTRVPAVRGTLQDRRDRARHYCGLAVTAFWIGLDWHVSKVTLASAQTSEYGVFGRFFREIVNVGVAYTAWTMRKTLLFSQKKDPCYV
jgi:hypothetical protein